MDNKAAYNVWANNYDTVINPTRDLEAKALRTSIKGQKLANVLELGCGTGKNTEYLISQAKQVVGADFSEEMLSQAKEKLSELNVEFYQIDLRKPWIFTENSFDLITCSLALEHIENIDFVFSEVRRVLRVGGRFYLGELYPFKQYQGSKARFETNGEVFELECYVHNIADYFAAGKQNGFKCVDFQEWFDEDDKSSVPRLLSMVFESIS